LNKTAAAELGALLNHINLQSRQQLNHPGSEEAPLASRPPLKAVDTDVW
jgi:hypothetical protein